MTSETPVDWAVWGRESPVTLAERVRAWSLWWRSARGCTRAGAVAGAGLVAVVALGAYCTRVGCYWPTVGSTPRRSGSRAVRTTPDQYTPTRVQYG